MNRTRKIKRPQMMFLRKIGKTPSVDWLIIVTLFVILVILAGIWGVSNFLDIKSTIKEGQTAAVAAPAPVGKTEEEQARDIFNAYRAKAESHAALFGKVRIDTAAERKNAPVIASTTASSSSASASTASTTAPARRGQN